jgi:hypothetical protein
MAVFPIDYRRFLSMFHFLKSGIYGIRDIYIYMVYIPFWLLNLIEFCFFCVYGKHGLVGKKNPLSLAWCWICLLWASLGFLFGGISKLVF